MEEYKGNSNKAKEQQKALPPEKKVEKIVSGPVKSKKKNSIQKITSIFVPEDVEDVKSYIFEDIVVPAVKDIILDAVRALLGVSGKSNKGAPASKVSYRSYYDRGNERNDYGRTRTRVGYDYDDCALPGFVDSKNEEKTERNAGYLVVSHSGGGMLRQGTRKGIRRTPANRGMRAHRIVKSLDISEDVCHGLCP